MFCTQCGFDNPEGNAFCTQCGRPLATAQPQAKAAQPAAAPVAQPAQAAQVRPTGSAAQGMQPQATQQFQPVPQAQVQAAQGAAPQYQQPVAQQARATYQPQPAQQYAYVPQPQQEGVLGAAWRDITSTPGWVKRVLILCLLSLVPILNLGVLGYILKWSRDLSFGKRQTMPNKIFEEGEIKYGFFSYLVDIVIGSAFALVAFAVVTIIGAFFGLFSVAVAAVIVGILVFLITIVGIIFLAPFTGVAVMRMVVVGQLESAFNIRKTWKAFRSSMGGAIVAVIVPIIVIGIISGILTAIFGAIMTSAVYSSMNDMYYGYGYGYGYGFDDIPFALIQSFASMGFGVVLAGLILCLILGMLSMFAQMLTYRALGHWAARNAAVWAIESRDPDAADEIMLDSKNGGQVITIPDNPVAIPVGYGAQPQAQVYRQPNVAAQVPAAQVAQVAPAAAPAAQVAATSPYAAAVSAAPAAQAQPSIPPVVQTTAPMQAVAPVAQAVAPAAQAVAEIPQKMVLDPAEELAAKYAAMSDEAIAAARAAAQEAAAKAEGVADAAADAVETVAKAVEDAAE